MPAPKTPKAIKRSPNTPLIWYARCPTLTALSLVASRGVFQREFLREGVYMVSVRETSAPSVRQGHLDHSLPYLIREADAATALWAHAQNGRSRLLAVGSTWHSVSVVTRPGYKVDGVRDLIGRRLSVPREAGRFSPAQARSLRAWESLLKKYGVSPKDIEFVTTAADHPSVPFGDIARREVEALLSGHTDAALLFGAKGLELARAAGLHEVRRFEAEDIRNDPKLEGLVELRALTVDDAFLDADPDIVARITGTLLQAGDWARTFPKEALRHIAAEGKVETPDAEAAYGSLIVDGLALGLEAERLSQIDVLHNWLKQKHLIPDVHSLDDWTRQDVLTQAETHLKIVA